MIVHFVDIDQLSVTIIQYQPTRHRQVVLTRLYLNAVWILYPKIKLTMNLYGLLHKYPLCVIRLYYQQLPLALVKPIIVHSIFWLWAVFSTHSTLSSLSFTPVLDNFIQILNVPGKYWILVLETKFEQINICHSLVTNGKFPQNVVKSTSRIANFPDLFFNYAFFQFNSKKVILIAEYLLLLMQRKFPMVKRWKFVIRYYFNA